MKTLKASTVKNSFKITGIYDYNTRAYSLEQMLKQCKTQFSAEEEEQLRVYLDQLINIMREQGEITDADMDSIGVPNSTIKDNLVLHRRRSLIMTNKVFIAREIQKHQLKDELVIANQAKKEKRKATTALNKAKKANKSPAVAWEPPAAAVPIDQEEDSLKLIFTENESDEA